MRRAAVQAFRTGRLSSVRKFTRRTPHSPFSSNQALVLRARSNGSNTAVFLPATLQSSMQLRNFSLAFISTLVASGAWYAYKGNSSKSTSLANPLTNGTTTPTSFHTQSVLPEESARRALSVENDQFYASSVTTTAPLSKTTDGKKVVEMLTPEQATQKLRRNEESYIVGRGRGVVRYDVVQMPSNDPIEDDHAEKIVEVPQSVAATGNGSNSSDWMFWGVFDGHS